MHAEALEIKSVFDVVLKSCSEKLFTNLYFVCRLLVDFHKYRTCFLYAPHAEGTVPFLDYI